MLLAPFSRQHVCPAWCADWLYGVSLSHTRVLVASECQLNVGGLLLLLVAEDCSTGAALGAAAVPFSISSNIQLKLVAFPECSQG